MQHVKIVSHMTEQCQSISQKIEQRNSINWRWTPCCDLGKENKVEEQEEEFFREIMKVFYIVYLLKLNYILSTLYSNIP